MEKNNNFVTDPADMITITKKEYLELKYAGTALNTFAREKCDPKVLVSRIDLISYSWEKKKIRIIESKTENERPKVGQMSLFEKFKNVSKTANLDGITIDVFRIIGNPPFESSILEDISTGNRKTLNQEQLIKILNFDI